MNKLGIIAVLITLFILGGGAYLFSRQKDTSPPTTYEYFWGNGCPHCKNVENFLSSWDKKDQVQITKYEVWNNTKNAKRMEQRAITCGIKPQGMGIPLLFTPDGKCFDGDEPIIQFLKELNL